MSFVFPQNPLLSTSSPQNIFSSQVFPSTPSLRLTFLQMSTPSTTLPYPLHFPFSFAVTLPSCVSVMYVLSLLGRISRLHVSPNGFRLYLHVTACGPRQKGLLPVLLVSISRSCERTPDAHQHCTRAPQVKEIYAH